MTLLEITALDAALIYAGRGWRVVPIAPGQKHPSLHAWQNVATVDDELIRQWWERWPDHGVGIATGSLSDLFVLDVDVADGKHGDDTLADLEHTHGPLPPTVEVITGSGGRHLYFRMPLLHTIHNDAGKRLGPGLDIRGEGGQVLAPPTIHPNGRSYQWEASGDPDLITVAQAPSWLIGLLTAEPNGGARRTLPPSPDYDRLLRPGDRWAANTSWPDLLAGDGATYLSTRTDHRTGTSYEMWARPGVDHASGTLYYHGSDVLKVFSSEWRVLDRTTGELVLLEQDATYTKFGYWAATRHGGDHAAAARAIAADLRADEADVVADLIASIQTAPSAPAAQPVPAAPQRTVNLRWVDELNTNMPPEPDVLVEGLLRAGELCVFGAPRAIGKTWLGYNLSILLDRGEGDFLGALKVRRRANVLYLQGELDQWGSATRWQMLTGITQPLPHVAETFDRLRIRTTKRRTTSSSNGITLTDEHVDAIIDDRLEPIIVEHGIDVVVIDPWAVYFAGSENSNDETEAALDKLRDITLRHGTAWVILHHIGKATDYREPEDLWRGASRLADWASTRVTILPHYTETKRRELGLERAEARRYADTYFLRRSTPTDDFHMQLEHGWWKPWTPPDDEQTTGRPVTVATYELVAALHEAGGTWTSLSHAATDLDVHRSTARDAILRAQKTGHVDTINGPRGAITTTLSNRYQEMRTSENDPRETTREHDPLTTLSDRPNTTAEQDF